MEPSDIALLVADLRAEGNDVAEVEVKKASGGYPQSLAPTLSAFGNTPGGGLIVFGLDEKAAFEAVGVYEVSGCKQAIAASARNAVDPPLTLSVESVEFEGAEIVVATIDELPASGKPCRVTSSGRAYLRSYDGDYQLSELEEQAFIANRSTPRFDQGPVLGAVREDLDVALVDHYFATATAASSTLQRFDREELLFRTGVLVGPDRVPSVAGLLSLGVYPQQFFPNVVIQASVAPGPEDPPGTRVSDSKKFDGPIPAMLDDAVRWVARNSRSRIRFATDGTGRDEPEYPLEAVRELLSNALVHRDLGPYSLGEATTLRLTGTAMVLSNPGGLYGISVQRLGRSGVTSARNGYLVRICQHVRTVAGGRVVEALASGIPTVLRAVAEAGMVPPRFHDQGIRFSVLMPNHALLAPEDLQWLARIAKGTSLSDTQRHVLSRMRHGEFFTNASLRSGFPMDSRDATRLLADLVDAGLAEAQGERGGRIYRLGSTLSGRLSLLDDNSTSTDSESRVLDVLADGPAARRAIQEQTGLTQRQIQYALQSLRESGQVQLDGGRGRRTSVYRISGDE
jgi:ATP-dependent DNA helicase RecG